MAFNRDLDVVVASKEAFADEKTAVSVSVHTYNGGDPKVQLSREYIKRDGTRSFRKLGRLTMAEATAVANVLPELMAEVAEAE
jgi:hypothetical protein